MTCVWTVSRGGKPFSVGHQHQAAAVAVWHWVGNAHCKEGNSESALQAAPLGRHVPILLPAAQAAVKAPDNMCHLGMGTLLAESRDRAWRLSHPAFSGEERGSLRNQLSNRSGWAELFWGPGPAALPGCCLHTPPVWHLTLLGLKWPYNDNVPWHGRLWMFCSSFYSNVLIAFKERLGFCLFKSKT